MNIYLSAVIGGVLIGLGATLLMFFNGRIAGISGITNRLFALVKGDGPWRVAFIVGMYLSGLIVSQIYPELFGEAAQLSTVEFSVLAVSGVLVGLGTTLGNGCASGHGVCGLARFSIRSIVAVVTFLGTGIVTVLIMNLLGVAA